ncbi:DC1 [Arabidopsis thaliana x Arabidopsis arenosa]|nr:DC1 [Arabidopsis thaliana x Arabidopsis arenosa]
MSLEEERDKRCCSCKRGVDALFYYCSICDFALHMACAGNPTSPTIDNPKRHKHTLHYFPRKSGLFCDVCALVDDSDYLYVCLLCDFIVHKRCVYLPYVIKVSRHNHRLTFTPNLPSEEPTVTDCGVCHAKINENYGEYSCTKKGCVYAVHSRCAMQSDVCDGKKLEGEPEEVYEDTKMFEEKGDGIIQHQSHPRHQLRLEKIFHDESHHCQACRRPSYDHGGNVYRCMQCDDFIFHESCAYLPRTKQFMLHVHPLTLDPSYNFIDWFQCGKCYRYSCGFRYACVRVPCDFFPVLDTLCASICEPFDHHSHPHSLFITSGEHESKICSICQSSEPQPLNCLKCDFVLCFYCATLPHKARYKHDEHFLTFSYEEDANDELYGCEICEEDINPKNGLYACNECGVTLHIECLLGRDPNTTPGSFSNSVGTLYILPNTYSTRPICTTCRRRCPYQIKINSSGGPYIFCSFDCYQRLCRSEDWS